MKRHQKIKKKVAIIGAGFGGISVAKELSGSKDVDIHIIDRRNHHLFQPLLYQVAMAGLNPSEIAISIRKFFSKDKNVIVTLAEVDDIDVNGCRVYYDATWKQYDYLILACGVKHSYFGNDNWETIAPGLKNIEQATEIRRRILTSFEMAEKEEKSEKRNSYLTFAVVGGGPTGVELAGAISELAKSTIMNEYKNANLSRTKVYLIEAGPRILSAFPENLSATAEKNLIEMGVSVLTNTKANQLSTDGLYAGDSWIHCKTIIWAAGVTPSSIYKKVDSEKDPQGRLVVAKDLSIKENSNIFAIGDGAFFELTDGKSLPGIAPVAIQQGHFVGKLIKNEVKGKPRESFKYWDKGIMATIGRSRAVVSSGKFQITGLVAWLAWVFIHILYLLKFKNRLFVFLQWTWAYFRFGGGAPLIIHKTWRLYGHKKLSYENDDDDG